MKKRFMVKVCGITRPKDARLAEQLGADMIGLIFYRKSPRFLSQRNAARVVKGVSPAVRTVGVFVDEPFGRIVRVAQKLRLDMVQLHGNEPVSLIRHLQREGLKVIKAFSMQDNADLDKIRNSAADMMMLDHRTAELPGGTGETFDWTIKPPKKLPCLVLAGGISADNVAEGVRRFNPLMVDVNSSVETRPGTKSEQKLKAFFAACDRIRYGR
ncbi:N-(5'-phosphoribosyl)anthranilate isomerase [candidate division GN15 bacterium]|nr:N-(5'-phosphoribosyl)anthranilate isomerase [candidate division GN15 bacterium]